MAGPARHAAAVVVGAGTAGLNAALQLARRGLSVRVVESRRLGEGGARWDNGVLGWQFARAGIAPPTPDEVHPGTGRTLMLGPGDVGPVAVTSPTRHADMRRLNDRLVRLCRDEGVDFLDRARDVEVEVVDGRVRALRLTAAPPDAGEPVRARLEADLFVDAGGRRGVLRSQVPELAEWCPPVGRGLLCTASQFMFEVADPVGAAAFLERRGAVPGDSVTWLGLDGGFSAVAIGVSVDGGSVSVLTGTIASGEGGSGRSILDRVLDEHRWIGEPRYGGDGLIPLRRPYARLGAAGVALVGDAACQVFPTHGSGIGVGMMAGAVLAEQVGGATDPGSDESLWAYQTAFHREHGGTLAAYDAFRRCTSAIGGDGVRRMFVSGLFTADMGASGLEQRWSEPTAEQTLAATRAYARDPGLARAMVPWLARCAVAARLGAVAPVERDLDALRRWDRRLARVVGG
jgi:flavin-dependent dehydrogenase